MKGENNKENNEIAINNNIKNHDDYINIARAYELANKNNDKKKTSIQNKKTW